MSIFLRWILFNYLTNLLVSAYWNHPVVSGAATMTQAKWNTDGIEYCANTNICTVVGFASGWDKNDANLDCNN